ncbi:Acetylornithine deacetylase/Succinyl-diaminopimelate desuccinylase [Leifsonia sp. 98AMF]|nr:Acetylornithine deacetylase/Succinyl-diaminopimelate desuccinylase [Leifsonia sp. 197AMF]SDI94412.1 Acetylornithine deacetylase/Succinyl-diaminopimelate desuccinylase [Leifsonia sp. 466MF]SDJ83121.1 Acetylornithine deacetylase/Succinyl-diaminopimelate desuccinylase [Leifsonia sp. 157MF]SDN98089.1 Acetylornithine deacetylase/Succinyl-diaminopimelate desuccinylase [Leifsonia sp. 509MF]SEN07039.1 Acetylornithine deacetylase/Succinyl-diaminopimelate desuccinylase [Leifsonia sp. 467MF]SFM10117.1
MWGPLKITRMTDSQQTPVPAAADDASGGATPGVEGEVRAAVEAGLPSAVADLSQLVRIPSVSWSAFDPQNVRRSAEAVAALLTDTGMFDSVEIKQAPIGDSDTLGQPAVLATRAAKNGRPTVLLYAHHDVQPEGDEANWDTPPFEPTVRGDRLYGRGAADDKAGVMTHVASVRALRDVLGDDLEVGLAVFIEGEEEFGSRSFANFLQQNTAALAADVIVVADSDNVDVNTPALTVSLRGNVTFRLTVSTLEHASHSGMFGGAAPDAMLAMVRLLATLHDDDGAVAVEGLTSYDAAAEPPAFTEEQLAEDAAFLPGVTSVGRGPILSRMWSQPTITVTGIDAPSVANASNTLLPSVAVRISSRVAPGQPAREAYEALERHLRAHAPFGAHIAIDDVDLGDPFLVDTDGWAATEAKRAMTDAWGAEAVETGVGGSIPFIADLVREFPAAQILVTGVEDPDTRAHSPNESLHLGVFKRAVLTEALLLSRLNGRTAS